MKKKIIEVKPSITAVKCLFCGRDVVLKLVGGQYQTTWQGNCSCGKIWRLEEYSEQLAEVED